MLARLCALLLLAGASVIPGSLPAPHLTGAATLGTDQILYCGAGDNALFLSAKPELANNTLRFPAFRPLGEASRVKLEDLADATSDGKNTVYVVTSHGRTHAGDAPDERYRLARLQFDDRGRLLEPRRSDALLKAIVNDVPFLADAIRRTPAKTGLNIGGLAWDPRGELLVGLRSPTITESQGGGREDAVVLRIKNPGAIFSTPAEPAHLGDTVKLDLKGQGIHGMCYDPDRKAWWIASGLSPDLGYTVKSPWGLWLWDGSAPPRRMKQPDDVQLDGPSAICRISVEGHAMLMLVQPGERDSRCVAFSAPL